MHAAARYDPSGRARKPGVTATGNCWLPATPAVGRYAQSGARLHRECGPGRGWYAGACGMLSRRPQVLIAIRTLGSGPHQPDASAGMSGGDRWSPPLRVEANSTARSPTCSPTCWDLHFSFHCPSTCPHPPYIHPHHLVLPLAHRLGVPTSLSGLSSPLGATHRQPPRAFTATCLRRAVWASMALGLARGAAMTRQSS